MTRPRSDERHPRRVGEATPGVGHVPGGGLVTRVDQLDAAPHRCVEDAEDPVARHREEMADAGVDERVDDETRAGELAHDGLR